MALYHEPPLSTAIVAGRRMAWREAGAGEGIPLFLMHGIGSNARAWAGQFADFAGDRRVVAWNAPGYAGSDPLDGDAPDADDYARAALALMDHLGIARCVLVGQSLGAVMATALALRAPERVVALALASPAAGYGLPPGAPLTEALARRIEDVRTLGPAGLAAARADRLLTADASAEARAIVHAAMAEVVPDGYAQAVHLLAGADLPRAAAGLAVPCLVLWGGADVVTPPAACRRVAEAIPHAWSVEIPGVGHAFATEAPVLFNHSLGRFLETAEARKA